MVITVYDPENSTQHHVSDIKETVLKHEHSAKRTVSLEFANDLVTAMGSKVFPSKY